MGSSGPRPRLRISSSVQKSSHYPNLDFYFHDQRSLNSAATAPLSAPAKSATVVSHERLVHKVNDRKQIAKFAVSLSHMMFIAWVSIKETNIPETTYLVWFSWKLLFTKCTELKWTKCKIFIIMIHHITISFRTWCTVCRFRASLTQRSCSGVRWNGCTFSPEDVVSEEAVVLFSWSSSSSLLNGMKEQLDFTTSRLWGKIRKHL